MSVIRLHVFRYRQSQRLAAVLGRGYNNGYLVIELTPDMQNIVEARNQKPFSVAARRQRPTSSKLNKHGARKLPMVRCIRTA